MGQLPPKEERISRGSQDADSLVIRVKPEVLSEVAKAGASVSKVLGLDKVKLGRFDKGIAARSWPVTLHVYDISLMMARAGMPFFHLGVEVLGAEISFGEVGIQFCWPGDYNAPWHRCSVLLGRTLLSEKEVLRLLQELRKEWHGDGYKLVGRNCQSFAVAFCERLGLENAIPPQYLRFARPLIPSCSSRLPCCGGGKRALPRRDTKVSL